MTNINITPLLNDIISIGSTVYSTDAGNGSGGPIRLDPSDLEGIIERGEAENYTPVTDAEIAAKIIKGTLWAFDDESNPTKWIVVEWVKDPANPSSHVHYLLLWDI